MRKTRRYLLITLLIAVAGVASWLLLRPDPEPTYKGKPLTFWCYQYATNRSLNSDRELKKQAEIAIRTIGTNAIPTLLKMLQAKDSKFKLEVVELSQKQHVINLNWKTAKIRHYAARMGFSVLGSDGKSAVPALLAIFNERSSTPYGSEQYDREHGNIADIFASMGPAAADAVPLLVQDTTDTNVYIRWKAVSTLGEIHARPDLVVPVLTRCVYESIDAVQGAAATSLGAFGNDAKSAVPELIQLRAALTPYVRGEATAALKKIDPEAAAKAGVK